MQNGMENLVDECLKEKVYSYVMIVSKTKPLTYIQEQILALLMGISNVPSYFFPFLE